MGFKGSKVQILSSRPESQTRDLRKRKSLFFFPARNDAPASPPFPRGLRRSRRAFLGRDQHPEHHGVTAGPLSSLPGRTQERSPAGPGQFRTMMRKSKSVSPLKRVKREAAAQRRPAQTKRKNRVFSAKRQAVWFETQSVSNWNCSRTGTTLRGCLREQLPAARPPCLP